MRNDFSDHLRKKILTTEKIERLAIFTSVAELIVRVPSACFGNELAQAKEIKVSTAIRKGQQQSYWDVDQYLFLLLIKISNSSTSEKKNIHN